MFGWSVCVVRVCTAQMVSVTGHLLMSICQKVCGAVGLSVSGVSEKAVSLQVLLSRAGPWNENPGPGWVGGAGLAQAQPRAAEASGLCFPEGKGTAQGCQDSSVGLARLVVVDGRGQGSGLA